MSTFMNEADAALYTVLTASSALTSLLVGGTADPSVYPDLAPQGTDCPYVVYQAQSPSTPRHTFAGVAIENALFTVKAVTQGASKLQAGTIHAKICAALENAALSITGYSTLYCRRVQDVDYTEVGPGGERYVHRGAIFRVQADPS